MRKLGTVDIVTVKTMTKVLKVSNLKKSFGSIEAVRNVDLEISKNQILALIGPNGAGKSTTLRIIATISTPTSGTVTVCGQDIIKDAKEVRKIISYLPEEAGAYKNLTGINYLKFMAALFSDEKQKQQEYIDFAREIAKGLDKRLNDKICTYSKGMVRKLLLARAVMTKPKLAILDEPTSGLDIINAMEIRKTIKELSRSGMAVLLSSHNMLEIEFLAEEMALINKGRIHDAGSAKELKEKYHAQNLEEVFIEAVR